MIDEMRELAQFRADPPPADPAAMSRVRAALVHHATTGRARRPRWRIPAVIAASAGVAAGLLILPATRDSGPTAYAVTTNPDGTVTLELTDISDMPAANKELQDLGVRAEVVGYQPKDSCDPAQEPDPELLIPEGTILPRPTDSQNVLTFQPDKIPANAKLVMIAKQVDVAVVGAPEGTPHTLVWSTLYPADSGVCLEDVGPYADGPWPAPTK